MTALWLKAEKSRGCIQISPWNLKPPAGTRR